MDDRPPGKVPEMLLDTTAGKDMSRGFTLIVCFSRAWCVEPFFRAFMRLKIDMGRCHLLVIDNSPEDRLKDWLTSWTKQFAGAFYTVRLFKTWRWVRGEMPGEKAPGWHDRKQRAIFEMHLDMMRLCTTDKFVLLEDDTVPPHKKRNDVVMRLLQLLEDNEKCGIATAMATGRTLTPFVKVTTGVYYVKRDGNKLLYKMGIEPRMRGVHRVDACGWYCCASYKWLWLKALEEMRSWAWSVPMWALDVMHTNNVVRIGWDILADFDYWCEHMIHTGARILYWGRRDAVPVVYPWLPMWKAYAEGVKLESKEQRAMVKAIACQRDRS